MTEWIDVIQERAFAEGEHLVIDVGGSEVAVFNLGGNYYAIQDACTHDGMELASGKREGEQIICPRHGARFCIKTGKALTPPAYEDLHCFPLRVENGMIQICEDRWD